jgi:hypothetical protein
MSVYPPIIARQRLLKNVNAATNTHATIVNCLTLPLLCRPCRIKGNLAICSSQEEPLSLPVFLERTFRKEEGGTDVQTGE